jgi:hypothetical protein
MSKEDVLKAIGKPNLIEVGEGMEWWLYLTTYSTYSTHTGKYVPVVFEEGQLIGWGESYWNNLKQSDKLENQSIAQGKESRIDANRI